MKYFMILLCYCFSVVAPKQLVVTGKNNESINILGYSSYQSYAQKVEGMLKNQIRDSYTFALQFNNTAPSVLLSRTTPDKLVFLELLHSFHLKNHTFTDFLLLVSSLWSFNTQNFKKFFEINFNFLPEKIYDIIKFIAVEKYELPLQIVEQIFYLNVRYKVFQRAATNGDSEVVRWLLKYGAWNGMEVEPLIIEEAWKTGKVNIIELLMEYGKINSNNLSRNLVNEQFNNNETLLHVASRNGFVDSIDLLVHKLGTSINVKDIDGKSPLYRAVEYNKSTAVEGLVSRGADIISEPLLALAVKKDNVETVKVLVKLNVSRDIKDENGDTPLFLAVKRNNIYMVETLGKLSGPNKALINNVNEFGDTLMHVAAASGFLDSAKSLLNLGVAVNTRNNFGETPLYKAVAAESLKVIEFLIKSGADLHSRTDLGDTILHLAASLGNNEIVQFLLSEKIRCPINPVNNAGETPLYKAAQHGKCEILNTLVKQGGDINQKNDGFTMLHKAAADGNERAVLCLINNGLNVDVRGLWDVTPLNLAVTGGHEKVVRRLLEKKANPNAPTKNLWTPLHRAAVNGNLDIIRLLHKYNANVYAKNDKELNPFKLARDRKLYEAALFIKTLFKYEGD